MNTNELFFENPPDCFSEVLWAGELAKHMNKVDARIDELREFLATRHKNPEKREFANLQSHLVHLLGTKDAHVFIEMLQPFIESAHKSDDELIMTSLIEGAKLHDALSRMIRLMAKLHINGEDAVEDISRYGNVHGINLVNAVIDQLEKSLDEERTDQLNSILWNRHPAAAMREINWCLVGDKYHTRADFDEAVRLYRLEVCTSGYWDPIRIAIAAQRIVVECIDWCDEEFNTLLEFESDNGVCFMEGELLFKIHNAVVEQCNKIDHRFFEGLDLDTNQGSDEVPRYTLSLGS